MTGAPRCLALAGGVGGSRLADGLYRTLPEGHLAVVVNTGDDFWLHGLRICPDLDTVMYALAGLADPVRGWGVEGDTAGCMDMLERLGAPTWFHLGDRDLAVHLVRTERLRTGATLTAATAELAPALGVQAELLPMCDEEVATRIATPAGLLDFQDYFVRRRQADRVEGVHLEGIAQARPTPEVHEALARADLVVLCPSNPFVSLGPILSVPGMREALAASRAPKVAVSPIVGGRALKGPAAAMLESLGHEVSALGVARLLRAVVDVFVLDEADAALQPAVEDLGLHALVLPTVMREAHHRAELARALLERLPVSVEAS